MFQIILLASLATTPSTVATEQPTRIAGPGLRTGVGVGVSLNGEPAMRITMDSELAYAGPWFLGLRNEAGHRGGFSGPFQEHVALTLRGGYMRPIGSQHLWTASVSAGPALTRWRTGDAYSCLPIFEPCPAAPPESLLHDTMTLSGSVETGVVLRWGWFVVAADVGLFFVGPRQATALASVGLGFMVP